MSTSDSYTEVIRFGLNDATASSHSSANKRRMSTGILKAASQQKKRRNVSFGGAHVRLFDTNANNNNTNNNTNGAPSVSVIPSPMIEESEEDVSTALDTSMEMTQTFGNIFVPEQSEIIEPLLQIEEDENQEENEHTQDQTMDFTRSHVFDIIQNSTSENTTDLATYYKNAGEHTKEVAQMYRGILQGDETGEIEADEPAEEEEAAEDLDQTDNGDETMNFTRSYTSKIVTQADEDAEAEQHADDDEEDEDIVSFKPSAVTVAPAAAPIEIESTPDDAEVEESGEGTMDFTRSFTSKILTGAAAASSDGIDQSASMDDSVVQDDSTMDFTRSFTAAIITNHATTTPGATGFLSPLRFPGGPTPKANQQQQQAQVAPKVQEPIEEAEPEIELDHTGMDVATNDDVTMEFTRSFTSAIVRPAVEPPTPVTPAPAPQATRQRVSLLPNQQQPNTPKLLSSKSAPVAPAQPVAAPVEVAPIPPPQQYVPRQSMAPKPAVLSAAQVPIPMVARIAPTPFEQVAQVVASLMPSAPAAIVPLPSDSTCIALRTEASVKCGELLEASAAVAALQAQHDHALELIRRAEEKSLKDESERIASEKLAQARAEEESLRLASTLEQRSNSKNDALTLAKSEVELNQLHACIGFRPAYLTSEGMKLMFQEGGLEEMKFEFMATWSPVDGRITSTPTLTHTIDEEGKDRAFLDTIFERDVRPGFDSILGSMKVRTHISPSLPHLRHLMERLLQVRRELRSLRQAFTVATDSKGMIEVTITRVDTLSQVIVQFDTSNIRNGTPMIEWIDTIGCNTIDATRVTSLWQSNQNRSWSKMRQVCQAIYEAMGQQKKH